MSRPLKFRYLVRHSRREDSDAISQLYVRTYGSSRGDGDHIPYPFPQFLEPEEIAKELADDRILRVVAEEAGGAIVGSAGAMRNIGGPCDRVAEVFGIVVDDNYRQSGIGTGLLTGLVAELGDSVESILCEARTAEPGGWKVARRANFVPVGFEPYAHAMHIGFESMLLTARGRWLSGPRRPSPDPRLIGLSRRLAEVVLDASPVRGPSAVAGVHRATRLVGIDLSIRRDDASGRAWFDTDAAGGDHRSGVLDLQPLIGRDRHRNRYDHIYLITNKGSSPLGCVQVTWDRADQRARILGLRTRPGEAFGAVLAKTVGELERLASPNSLTILVNLRADASELQAALEALEFRPTAYVPGLIGGPADAIQYTCLRGRSWCDSLAGVTALAWPAARRVIGQVLGADAIAAGL